MSSVKVVPPTSDDEASEDHVPVPTFQSAFSEALAASWCNSKDTDSKQQHDHQSNINCFYIMYRCFGGDNIDGVNVMMILMVLHG